MKKYKCVVIGGGTGSFSLLSGLKQHASLDLTAIVASTDSGGSTGRLRDEFGFLPVGDIRQCLVALAENSEEQFYLRKLFSYRFDKGGEGLEGHNLGNLFMTALREITGDELTMIRIIEKLFSMQGHVLPVTLEKGDLVAEYDDGTMLKTQHAIDKPSYPHDPRARITKLYIEPEVQTHDAVRRILVQADIIVLAPGDVYTSLLANIVVQGVAESLCNTTAPIVYVANLVTKFGQTTDFMLKEHVSEIEKYIGKQIQAIFWNSTPLPLHLAEKYKKNHAQHVRNNMADDSRVIEADMLATSEIHEQKGDALPRSFIRHDGEKVAHEVMKLITR